MPPSQEDSPRSSFHNAFREAGPYLTLGLEMGFTMIIWAVIGYLLDRWLETMPWLTLSGVLVGMASVFLQLARAAKRSQRPTTIRPRSHDNGDAHDNNETTQV